MTPHRVAYVVNTFPKVSETFIAGELAEIRRRGIEARVLSLKRPDESLQHAIVAEARLVERTVYDPEEFSAVLEEFRPDLVHAHFATEPTATARRLATELGVPFVFTAHGYDVYRRPPLDFAQRAEAAGAVVTVSEANARHIVQTFGIPADRLHVISCGVDTNRFTPAEEKEDPPIVACVARLRPVKNLELLLRACAALQARRVPLRCVILGEGPSRPDLEALRTDLGLDHVVTLLGAVEQEVVTSWLQRAAVAVLTSLSEGMPVSLMEAAACGVPAVAPAVGGIPELIEDGVTGLVTAPDDAPALAMALERLLLDGDLRARMGAAARRRAEERFSRARQVDRLIALWCAVLRRRKPRP
jgi:colanic acid/amylovoran biosynthesis glycosyltransferase